MLKKTVTYTDYNGVERTEDFYFNLTRSELMEMHLTTEGGMDEKINSIIKAKSQPELEKLFKEILLKSYGKKSPDGRLFMKNDEIRAEFEASPVYDELYVGCHGLADRDGGCDRHFEPPWRKSQEDA